jgi:hypothetical protein
VTVSVHDFPPSCVIAIASGVRHVHWAGATKRFRGNCRVFNPNSSRGVCNFANNKLPETEAK